MTNQERKEFGINKSTLNLKGGGWKNAEEEFLKK